MPLPFAEATDGALHTQLWIDPAEELQEYFHQGEAVDVTFSVKELKVSWNRSSGHLVSAGCMTVYCYALADERPAASYCQSRFSLLHPVSELLLESEATFAYD